MSPSSRRAWIEIVYYALIAYAPQSPSSRRAWIEIVGLQTNFNTEVVALLAEGVD